MNRDERLRGLLLEVSEFLEPYVDVRDGEDGPLPNKAMSLKAEVDAEIERIGAPVSSEQDQEQCSYCKEWYPKPVSLHHTTEECRANEARSYESACKKCAKRSEYCCICWPRPPEGDAK